ncbi:hypothetical protein [Paenibacillus selenitireducens]|jgi:hypothetical protein|nr:hypothetical protein [Paenibacillus selenitireducens]
MNYHISKVKEIRKANMNETNELLSTGMWKVAQESTNEFGECEYILHRVK